MEIPSYIKFHCVQEYCDLPENLFREEVNVLRSDLHKTGLVGITEDGIGYGNVSFRYEDGFVITASATGHLPILKPEHYSLVTKCDISANTVWARGRHRASSESMTHAAVYLAAPSVNVVVHAHYSPYYKQLLQGNAPATEEKAAFGTPEMAFSVKSLVEARPKDGVIVMKGHENGFLIYAENTEHIRDLVYMLSLGYIPL